MNRRNFIKNTLIAAAVAAGGSILGKTAKSALLRENKKMKILVLTGSPRPNGNSNTLADNFIKGAEAAGHKVFRFDAAFKQVHPCIACNSCGMNGPCVFKDDFEFVRTHIIDADMVVFASPIYWFDIPAQEKAAIDRLYAFGATGFPFTKTALLLDSHSEGVYDAAIAMYKSTCAYCKWEDQGIVTISGMTERDSMASSPKLKEVRELARKLA